MHDLHGRLAAAGPHTVDVELRLRDGTTVLEHAVPLTPDDSAWTAALSLGLATLAGRAHRAPQAWDIRVRIHCVHGGTLRTAVRAVGTRPRPLLLWGSRYGMLLAQPRPVCGARSASPCAGRASSC